MTKRSKATDISAKVRASVYSRDKCKCIFCYSPYNLTIAHYISRGSGGLGIEQNLTLACARCHIELDHGVNSKEYRDIQRRYLEKYYPNFKDSDRRYKKYG